MKIIVEGLDVIERTFSADAVNKIRNIIEKEVSKRKKNTEVNWVYVFNTYLVSLPDEIQTLKQINLDETCYWYGSYIDKQNARVVIAITK